MADAAAVAAGLPVEEKQLPISRAVVLFGVIPALVVAHVTVYWQNTGQQHAPFDIALLWVSPIRVTVASVMLNAWLYGILCCAGVFYIRQLQLQSDLRLLQRRFDDMKSDKEFIDRKYKRLITAANQILVPYRLDALVDKGIEDFAAGAYKPGMLQADVRAPAKM